MSTHLKKTRIGPCLASAVLSLDTLGECEHWDQFAMVGTYNAMRHLKARELIEDLAAPKRAASEFKIVIPRRWRLTTKGKALANELRAAYGLDRRRW